ncbi:MAG: murein L,D-transpeptidase catalytic domain family protein [Bdellovibrionaceae bacterium]|nr:murein L,D-transpeptidase catalytic domain family protein [Pseudobdellovibrionaceae bacterium]
MKKFLKILIVCTSISLLAACDLDDSLSGRMVGEDQTAERDLSSEQPGEEDSNTDDNSNSQNEEDPDLEDHLNEDTTNNERMRLVDKVLKNSNVSADALNRAVDYFDANKSKFSNKRYMAIVDFTQHSGRKRLYIIDLVDGSVEQLHVSHGSGSDKNHDGYAESFSNVSGSHQSSLGFVKSAETYYGKRGYSLRLDGLESRNSRVRSRAIVIHGASYVDPSLAKMGRSQGCPAVTMSRKDSVINRLKNGALIYLYHASNP